MGNVITKPDTEDSPKSLLPKGYKLVATRETNAGERVCEAYYNPDLEKFFIRFSSINRIAGPFTQFELETFKDIVGDLIWMKGQFTFIEEN